MKLGPGWARESAELFVHESGARIAKTTYRGKVAWWFFPVSLDVPAVEHAPTDEGRDAAFATSERELPKRRSMSKAIPKKKRASLEEEEKDHSPEGDPASAEEDADDEEKDEDGE